MLPSALKVDQWNLSLRSNASIPNGVKNSFALILLKKVVNYSYSRTGYNNYFKKLKLLSDLFQLIINCNPFSVNAISLKGKYPFEQKRNHWFTGYWKKQHFRWWLIYHFTATIYFVKTACSRPSTVSKIFHSLRHHTKNAK